MVEKAHMEIPPESLHSELASPVSLVAVSLEVNVGNETNGDEMEEASGAADANREGDMEVDSFSVTATGSEVEETSVVNNGSSGRTKKPAFDSKISSAKAGQTAKSTFGKVSGSASKHVSSTGQSHSAESASPRPYLKSSSAAAIARRTEAANSSGSGDGTRSRITGNGVCSSPTVSKATPVLKRMGASGTTSDAPATPVRRNSLISRTGLQSTPSKPTTPIESRRASLSSLSTRSAPSASELQKWAASPAKASSIKGPTFGRPTSLTIQSPRSSTKPGTPDALKRSSPSSLKSPSGAMNSSVKPPLSSPRTPSISTGTPSTSLKTPTSNGVAGATASRKKPSPVGGSSIKQTSSFGSTKSASSKHSSLSDTASSTPSYVSKRPSSPLSVSSALARRKSLTSESRDSRYLALPQVDVKAGDDVRLDLRGQKVRSLDCNLVNLTPKLEFVYLRDNKLSTLAGIEILKRVKVLDLSFNEFKGPGFEPLANCKALQQLYLAGNQITSLSGLPELPNLEFLSVAQNKLKSLAMATQPSLQVLAASKNKITTLKGFPHLPVLEHLRLEENPILEMPHLEAASILLVGPTLKKYNDRDLTLEEQELARQYPAHTPMCIRSGWDFCGIQDAHESTMEFLVSQWSDRFPPGYVLKKALIESPAEEDPCQCHFVFENENGDGGMDLTLHYQWYIGDRTPINFVPIEGANSQVFWPKHDDIGRCLKVECKTFVGGIEYPPIFAVSLPITPGTGCPKVLNLIVDGEPVEGSVVRGLAEVAWCGGRPGKGFVSWLRQCENSSPVTISGAEQNEYRLTLDDVGANLLLMYTPVTEEGVKGESHFTTTATILSAPPHVSNVHIIGDAIDGETIRGIGKYFGGREGQSRFEWLREDSDSGEFKLVSRGKSEYVLMEEDVGLHMMFIYTPVNSEGYEGNPVSAITGKVLLAPPKVTELKIIGDIREGNKVFISAIISGGIEGASRVQWFKTNSAESSMGDANLEAISTSKIAKSFHIPLGAVGFYLAAKYTPVRSDGESGEPALVFSDSCVEMLPPSLNFLSITGEFLEGETVTASYGYTGGHEGSSKYNWYLHESEDDDGIEIHEVAGLLQYVISKEAVNKFISFRCVPMRDDGLIGEGRSTMVQEQVRPGSPKLLSLKISGDPMEGSELQVDKKYWGGDEGSSKLQWLLITPDGAQQEIKAATNSTYKVRREDIDGHLCVSCEPIRRDGAIGPVAMSQIVGPIFPAPPTCDSLELCGLPVEGGRLSFKAVYNGGEKGVCRFQWVRQSPNGKEHLLSNDEVWDLTSEDVGCQIELVFTPVRKDGFIGTPHRVISDVVKEAEPVGMELVVPDCHEDVEIVPLKSYFGGREGVGAYTWFRLQFRLEGSEVPEEAQVLADSITYIPKLEEVGSYLALRWIPTRNDGKKGKPLMACSMYPIAPAPPAVHRVKVTEVAAGVFVGGGEYHGGLEGDSQMSWYRERADGEVTVIAGVTLKSYTVTDYDYTCRLIFGYTPVRQDGAVGKQVLSEPTVTILPDLPKVQKLVLTGKAVEGQILTALEVMPKDESQKYIWEKFKKDVKYEWSRSTTPGIMNSFEVLSSQRSCSYKARLEDIGFYLRCECIVTDIFGRSVEPISVVSSPVTPGMPKVEKLEIEGRGYHTNLYAVRGTYSGGKEGKSTIQWFRAMAGSPDLIPIPGEIGRMYEANVDDVGYRLVAIYIPFREDGVKGAPVSASTEPIAVEPEVAKEVKQKLELGAVKFEALRDRDRSPIKAQQQQGLGSLERRVLDVNRKRVKVVKPGSKTSFPSTEFRGTYAPPFHVELFRNDQHRLKIVIDSENEVDLMVQTRHMRDVTVLVIRGLAQKFNSTPLNILLKM